MLSKVTRSLEHRGPDDFGTQILSFGTGWVGLGQQRLSIIDLSAAGHQPMRHSETGSWITYNGEIYNFKSLRAELEGLGERFVGHSDTEVLLAMLCRFGPAALRRIEGMYAFAFVDAVRNQVILARDPVGIKPLYMARTADSILFASEVRGILASGVVPAKLSPSAVASYLAYGAVQEPFSLFTGIESLPPGTWIEIAPGRTGTWEVGQPQAHWEYPDPMPGWTPETATQQIRTVLDVAVRDHLVSDVPVGVFLSSGLDSTAVAGFAAKHSPHIRSFTVGFGGDHPNQDETRLAAATAKRLGLVHTEVHISNAEAERATTDWLEALDQPSIDGLNTYVIAKAVRAQGIKVALSGLGGDELFCGYPSFWDVPRLRRVARLTSWLPRWLRRFAGRALGLRYSGTARDKLADLAGTDGSLLELYLCRRRAMSDGQLAELGLYPESLGLNRQFVAPASLRDIKVRNDDPVWSVSVLESRFYQGSMLLRDADANSMAHGLEIRVPMLDRRLLNLAHVLPGPVRMPPGERPKCLLRSAAADYFSDELLNQPKMGFALPIGQWMRTSQRGLCEESLATLKKLGIVQAAGVERLWNTFLANSDERLWSRVFSLCVLGAFARRTGATV